MLKNGHGLTLPEQLGHTVDTEKTTTVGKGLL